MFKLDNALLEELGLGSLPPEEKNRMLAHIYETLEMRVGMKLAEQMSNEQLDEFEGFIDKNDEAGALKWLETNFPNYKQVVADQLELLKNEVKQAAPQIVAASRAQAAQMGQPPMPNPPAPAPAPSAWSQPPAPAPASQAPFSPPNPMPQPPAPGTPSQFQPAPPMQPEPPQPAPFQPGPPPANPFPAPEPTQNTPPTPQPMPPQWQ